MPFRCNKRRAATLVLMTIMLAVVVGILAFAVDTGFIQATKTQLQRSADAAAMAACWELMETDQLVGTAGDQDSRTRNEAAAYMALNKVLLQTPNLALEDVQIGYLNDPSDPAEPMKYDSPSKNNAVRVRVRRTDAQNGEVGLFFGRAMGTDSVEMEATATAAFLKQIRGFKQPKPENSLGILPIALDIDTWTDLLLNAAPDNYHWNADTKQVTSGSDSVLEINLYPQGIGMPGNRGTVDIGSQNNSTSDIARQVVYGLSASDLAYHGGKLELDASGKLYLNGDTGISAGIKDELTSVIGRPSMIPIFDYVENPGDNCTYTIVDFVGVRILDVRLEGPMEFKKVIIQPAKYLAEEAIGDDADDKAYYIYSPVWIVR